MLEEKEDMGSDEARQGQLLATTTGVGDEHVGALHSSVYLKAFGEATYLREVPGK